jgi:hypothetical protein
MMEFIFFALSIHIHYGSYPHSLFRQDVHPYKFSIKTWLSQVASLLQYKRSEVLTAVHIKITVFWKAMPYGFGGTLKLKRLGPFETLAKAPNDVPSHPEETNFFASDIPTWFLCTFLLPAFPSCTSFRYSKAVILFSNEKK